MFSKKMVLASLLGGLTMFVWGALSHTVIPLSENSLLAFTSEDAVVQAIAANAPKSGVYFLPWVPQKPNGMTEDQFNAAKKAAEDRMAAGPFMLASIRIGPMGSFAGYLITQLITDILTALCICIVLSKAKGLSFKNQVMSIVFMGLAGFCATSLPEWNWYAFSSAFTLAELFDLFFGFLFGGLVIARLNPVPQQ